jgi:amino acid transporter/nucleotide-binding universal stress UspA family protein
MLVAESRPRNLKWYHSGALLFGDWGTSRLYVLGLTFFFTAHASVFYLAAVGVLMIAVAWAYVVVCRSFPEGGGVYTAARQINPTLSVVGATLLLCGYIMTAAISVVEAFHYFGLPRELTLSVSFATILAIGVINWFGAHAAGRAALFVAVAAGLASFSLAIACIPLIPEGVRNISWDIRPPSDAWVVFTRLCLAMAGIEAVANMTGVMRQPVVKTARRTIWPVAIEVVFFNLFFALALMGLMAAAGDFTTPDAAKTVSGTLLADMSSDQMATITLPDGRSGEEVLHHRDVAMKVLAIHSGQHWLGQAAGFYAGKVAAIVFGLLLLSAANTAIMAMVSVLFAMGQDRELPRPLTRLNYSGVPWIGLLLALVFPMIVLLITQDPQILAELYVIGVIGAVTTNILSCAINRAIPMRRAERTGMWTLGVFLFLIAATIVITKPNATIFAGTVIAIVLLTRFGLKLARPRIADALPEPAFGWLAEVKREAPPLDPARPRIMLAARGRYQSEFAVDLARRRGAALFAIYVRTLRLIDVAPGKLPRIEEDPDAQKALGTTALLAREAGVPFFPIYVTSTDIAAEILDYTVTYGCDTLIMGKSLRTQLARRLTGDVVAQVARMLPDNVALLSRSPEVPHIPGTSEGVTFHDRTEADETRRDDVPPPT